MLVARGWTWGKEPGGVGKERERFFFPLGLPTVSGGVGKGARDSVWEGVRGVGHHGRASSGCKMGALASPGGCLCDSRKTMIGWRAGEQAPRSAGKSGGWAGKSIGSRGRGGGRNGRSTALGTAPLRGCSTEDGGPEPLGPPRAGLQAPEAPAPYPSLDFKGTNS